MFDFELSTHPHLDDALRAFAARHNITKLAKLAGLNPQTVSNKLNPDQPHELTVREMLQLIAVSEDMSLMDAALRQVNCLPAVAINELAREKLDHYALRATTQIGLLAAHASQHERMTPRRRREIVETVNTGIRYLSLAALAVQVRIQSNPAIASTMDMAGAIGTSVGIG